MNLEVMEKKLYDACLKGDVEMLEALMKEDELILARISLSSCFNQTPLHLACMLGHFDFAKSLLSFRPDFLVCYELGTALHLCVMHNRLNVLKLILESTDQELPNFKDDKGNTILHSATTLKRLEIIEYLVMNKSEVLNVNAVNENGVTALDIVEQMPKDEKTMEIKKLLVSRATDQKIQAGEAAAETDNDSKWWRKKWKKFTSFTIFQEKQEQRDESLLVAATVIAAMAYSAAISPPGGVAAMDAKEFPDIPKNKPYHLYPAASLLAYFNPNLSYTFWISNHISFMASLSVIFLYVSGATLKRRFFTWLIRGAMWITLTSMTIAYVCAVTSTTGSNEYYDTLYPLIFGLLAWGILIFVSFVVLIYRLHRYIMPKITNKTPPKKKNTNIV